MAYNGYHIAPAKPVNKRGKYGFRDIAINEVRRYPDIVEVYAMESALRSFCESRLDFDPRYFVTFQRMVLRVKNQEIKDKLDAMDSRQRYTYFMLPHKLNSWDI